MPDAGYVYLSVKGDFDVDEFTAYVGVTPTTSWNRGQKDQERDLPRCSLWDYSSPKVKGHLCIDELANDIVDTLSPRVELFRQAKNIFDVSINLQVVIYIDPTGDYQTSFRIGFDESVVRFISSLDGYIDVDSYLGKPLTFDDYTQREP